MSEDTYKGHYQVSVDGEVAAYEHCACGYVAHSIFFAERKLNKHIRDATALDRQREEIQAIRRNNS